ncbi:MAG: type II toxin-antitoxin system VapC family toxin [Candidatus Woesearchaeota archaeon]
MTEVFFADTYALFEIIFKNDDYKRFLKLIFVTTKSNLVEFYYHLLKDYGKNVADAHLKAFSSIIIPVTYESIQEGMKFKLKFKKEKLSYVDCIGYALALEYGIKFLTGDQKFEFKDNVEFVK